ncbi:MAG: M6 family metalloprotease domain-containing protein [Muribaculaceae bacterium]|nr:M6 family metalloprotease domain-containing protein [Muribaculaceae bacterium]
MNKVILSLLSITLCAFGAYAVPASPAPATIIQPDGSLLTIELHGDEFYSYSTTTDGYTVIQNEDTGVWEYALSTSMGIPMASGIRAANASFRDEKENAMLSLIGKGIRPDYSEAMKMRQTTTSALQQNPLLKPDARGKYDISKFRGLVILVEYEDAPFSRNDYYEIINDMVNKKGFTGFMSSAMIPSLIPCTGSVRDYYYDNSNGKFDPVFDVYGPVKIDYSQYSANKSSNAQALVTAALRAANDEIDYSKYDTDGDRKVDMVYFIFSGGGSNYSGNDSRLIWPHASTVMSFSADGVSFDRYACSTELYGMPANKQLDGIGTICHEFSHVLGLPDLYDTDYESSGGQSVHPAKWSVMASGSYLNASRTPCGYSLYERYALGFAQPVLIDKPGDFELEALNVSNQGYRINSSVKNEFFLLENRNKTRWDEYLPGEGLLIHRVDSTEASIWDNNRVNANPVHNYYTLLRANPKTSGSTVTDSDGDPFPGSANVTEITNLTTPSLQAWSKVATPLVLKKISINADGDVSFSVKNEEIPTLIESFELFPVMESSASNIEGAFTTWSFTKGAKVVEITDASLGLGTRAVSTVKSAEFISGKVEAEVESFAITVHNASAASAIVRAYYSTNNGVSWVSVTNIEGTGNPSVAAGTTARYAYNIGAVKDARYRFVQYSGSSDGSIFFDDITFNCKPGTLGVSDVMQDASALNVAVSGGTVEVYADMADGTEVLLYSLQGALVSKAKLYGGVAALPGNPGPGIYIVRCGNSAVKVCIK